MKKNGFLFLIFLAFLTGCSTNTEEAGSIEAGKEYYPLKTGNVRIYKVKETRIQLDVIKSDTMHYLRERVDTMYNNLAGEKTYRIIRSTKFRLEDPWVDDSLITVTETSTEIRRLENNVTYLKMVFPVNAYRSWSQNLYNSMDFDSSLFASGKPQQKPRETRYIAIGQPYTLNTANYPKTVTIETVRQPGNIYLDDRRVEVYAENVGLIYRNYNILEKCDISDCGFDTEYVLRGYKRTDELIATE